MRLPPKYCDRYTAHTISRWDEGLPLGNGAMGALLWGPANALRLSLDRTDLWDTTPYPGVSEPEFTYANLVRLAREKNEAEIRRIFDAPYEHTTPCKLPAGRIVLHLPETDQVESRLSLAGAEARLQAGDIKLECFLHAQARFGLLRIRPSLAPLEFTLEHPAYAGPDSTEPAPPGSLKNLRYPPADTFRGPDEARFVQETGQMAYGVFVKARRTASETLLAFTVAASRDGPRWRQDALDRLDNALDEGYDRSFVSHCQWWADFWGKSSLRLPDRLYEKNWYLTNYILASCSRKGAYPMPLQGVWTADDGSLPPWKGDYHHDLNTQLSYSHYCKANHLPEGESFLDFLWSHNDCARRFAREFYGVEKGLCLPSVMSIDGQPLGGWAMYALSPTNQIWLAFLFDMHFRYTGDRDFLENRARPYLRETADCMLGLLEERDGRLYLPISSSPEIHDDRAEAFLTPNSNYDLALLRWLFGRLAELEPENPSWQKVLQKLPSLAVDQDGVLLLSPDEAIRESHRHHSNLMAIYPLCLLDPENPQDRKILDASLLDLERRGTGCWCGYSFAWAAALYAVQGNGNAAARQLWLFWNDFCGSNGFHLNGDYLGRGSSSFHYRPFTLEGNMCAAAALQEMLLQCRNGVLKLFPAIPDEWKEKTISFTGFRAEGGVLVSARHTQGRVTALTLKGSGPVRLRCAEALESLARKYGWPRSETCWTAPCGSYRE